ncbi:class I SAM-dependent methyltransferase [Altererythrobacter lutimaris]|uniref:Class I SAM-dependent methyltransferase n=1 Tax=Altererythrobacter lutimaris TaxID=2743979 RepID=A0A850HGB8_9SPHN|nr:class I SAM-dependent methyltransferase [Altererythrobacter lutimaris]NVE93722.1 class I SAM-dependent methyltransferase [Altererythrobacter lutimaris]
MQRRFRRQRAQLIKRHLPQIHGAQVVDIGGSLHFWSAISDIITPSHVKIFNLSEGRATGFATRAEGIDIEVNVYDGRRVPVDDGVAEVVVCNSVIEHVPLGQRANLVSEIKRTSQTYVVQTPSPLFPLELHFMVPFLHWLPRKLGRLVAPWTPFGLLTGANAREYFDETRLLSRKELQAHFPDDQIMVETFFGIPKSYVVVGGRAKGAH